MKRLIKRILREFREPIILKDVSGITQVYDDRDRYEAIKKDIEKISNTLNRNIVIIPIDFEVHE
ncbi:hypothetical protein ACV3TP_02790 [Clostridium perfringens]